MGNTQGSAAYQDVNGNDNDFHDDDDDDTLDPFDGIDTIGYRVLGVQPNSPAAKAGLVSFLDFLVGAQGQMLLGSGEGLQPGEEYNDVDLPALLNEYKEKPMEFLVYNIKSQQARLVELTPSDQWGGAGLLGVTIRLDNYAGAEDRLVRILTVEPQSPAAIAGLVPFKDFLLGTTHQTLNSSAELATLLRQHEDHVVELYVYNTDSDMVRVVALMPTLEWGGKGLLGAEVGTGYLHRLPSSARTTEGTSVERKVRYVGVLPTPTTSQSQQAQTSSETAVAPTRTLLEVEPQLEMEVDHGEDDESEESAEEVDIPQKQPPPPVTTTTQPAVVEPIRTTSVSTTTANTSEAEALFQRPPSQSAVPFPPPPKMHYT
ncbi:hypothetical protein FisN_1Lh032 [Fistulifera solaris]|uniref:PDZ GRASP-type domain-containing protein n=1 Tax=Fistulifera solaris TaxID=1519565 RepID=A0A1Z5JC72_FISSO|nr:hypothetical protein FisN_1Lh032 [Fistulifera solaris]|eukprot:GAX11603.1 hypothetical protein FisN_1Lh032 [Fistulifera solaris]